MNYFLYSIISMPTAMIFANYLFKIKKPEVLLDRYLNVKPSIENGKSTILVVSILFLAAVIASIYVLYRMPVIPIFSLFKSATALELARYRIMTTREFPGIYFIKYFFVNNLLPVLSLIYYAYCLNNGKKIYKKIWLISFLLCCFMLLVDTQKGPILKYLLMITALKYYHNGKLSKKQITAIFLAILLLVSVMYFFIMGIKENVINIFIAKNGFIGRQLIGQVIGLFYSFEVFPKYETFQGLSQVLPNFLSRLMDVQATERGMSLLWKYLDYERTLLGITGTLNSYYLSEAWYLWGRWGAILSPIYLGILLQALHIGFLKSKKNPVNLAFYSYVSFISITGGFAQFLYDSNYYMLLLIYAVFVFQDRYVKIANKCRGESYEDNIHSKRFI